MNKRSLGIIWFFIQRFRLRVAVVTALSFISGALDAVNIAALYPILNAAFPAAGGGSNFLLSMFTRLAEIIPLNDRFLSYCVVFLIIAGLTFISKVIFTYYKVKLSANIVEVNQQEIFNKFIKADYQYFVDHKQGDLIYNLTAAPTQISTVVSSVADLLQQVILSISIIILLVSLSWLGTLVVIIIAIGYQSLNQYLGKRISYTTSMGEMEANRSINVTLNEMFTGIKQIKVYGTSADWTQRFSSTNKSRWAFNVKRNFWMTIPSPFLYLVLYAGIGIIALTIKIVAAESFTELIPTYGTFAFAIFRLFPIISNIGGISMVIMSSLPNCEVVYKIFREKISFIEDGREDMPIFNSGIRFDHVTFTYKKRSPILKDVTFMLEKGQTTALLGRSGSGKTTIINLLLHLFEPDSGEIWVDGKNLKNIRLSSWLDKIGFVDQDTFIMNDTVKNNITFCVAGYSDEDVIAAARHADIHDFIMGLPEKYETMVGDKGARLSGGQRQRIAIARAIIKKPEIFIFDEATNALDSISERAVQNAIDNISKDHTVIVIAHRLSTIVNADKIIVILDGQVAEEGKHEELIEKRGTYWKLYKNWSK